jgi:hypothetical protein
MTPRAPAQDPNVNLPIRASTSSSADRRTATIFEFDSGDDDIPLQRNQTVHRTPTSSLPAVVEKPTSNPASLEQSTTPPRRALRTRKPEQQMPYTLDLIRHRNQFRRRGLKPVHNPGVHPHPVHEADEQYQADDDEGEMDNDERYIPPPDVQERAAKRRKTNEIQTTEDNDETDIHLQHGRKKFLDPRRFDPNKPKPKTQTSPNRQVHLILAPF